MATPFHIAERVTLGYAEDCLSIPVDVHRNCNVTRGCPLRIEASAHSGHGRDRTGCQLNSLVSDDLESPASNAMADQLLVLAHGYR